VSSLMTKYLIVVDGPHDFGVEISAPGSFLSVRGFTTELAAQAWVEEQQFRDAAARRSRDAEQMGWSRKERPPARLPGASSGGETSSGSRREADAPSRQRTCQAMSGHARRLLRRRPRPQHA
jgi:hypothetical protein